MAEFHGIHNVRWGGSAGVQTQLPHAAFNSNQESMDALLWNRLFFVGSSISAIAFFLKEPKSEILYYHGNMKICLFVVA